MPSAYLRSYVFLIFHRYWRFANGILGVFHPLLQQTAMPGHFTRQCVVGNEILQLTGILLHVKELLAVVTGAVYDVLMETRVSGLRRNILVRGLLAADFNVRRVDDPFGLFLFVFLFRLLGL
jgi:hypothetical protein